MLNRRRTQGLNLAFLDVMSCGLGAVILLFMLVKFNTTSASSGNEIPRLKKELQTLTRHQGELEKKIKSSADNKKQLLSLLARIKTQQKQLLARSEQLIQSNKIQSNTVKQIEKKIVRDTPKTKPDRVELKGQAQETYLLGMKVEGANIGILIDHSASMSDEKLVNVIQTKFDDDNSKRLAPKWKRTVRVARWLLARIPSKSNVSVASFNDNATQLGAKKIFKGSDNQAINNVALEINNLVPERGTNLQTGLAKMKSLNPKLSDLYIITDGLPTLGERSPGLKSYAKCGSFFGKSNTISGECRELLFYHTVKMAALFAVKVNVILLPLEGDPSAPKAYWDWASSTGGLLLSPAESWP